MSIQDDIDRKRREIQNLEAEQRCCSHEWNAVQYDPHVTQGYSAPPQWAKLYMTDVPLIHVPGETTPRWKRCCKRCGLVQYTKKTRDEVRAGAVAGTRKTEQVPDFGDER